MCDHSTLFALKVSQSMHCVTSISHGVVNYFPGLWGTGICDAIFRPLTTYFLPGGFYKTFRRY